MGIVIIIINIIVFLIYGYDKHQSKTGGWRVREATLIGLAFLGGTGAFWGMMLFRHKTKKFLFKILVPIGFLLNIYVCLYAAGFKL